MIAAVDQDPCRLARLQAALIGESISGGCSLKQEPCVASGRSTPRYVLDAPLAELRRTQ